MESFSAETPLLRFHRRSVEGARRWVAWPAWGFQVVAPRRMERRLNVFQRAVLGLCRAGKNRADEIGPTLLVGSELAAHVLLELRQLGLLDHRFAPTKQAVRMLEEDEASLYDEQIVGYVFTDPLTGEAWPRFSPGDLPYAETALDNNRLKMLSGSVGNPGRNDDVFVVRPLQYEPVLQRRPAPPDILRAVRLHHRHYDWEDDDEAADAPLLHRIAFVSDDPSPFLLAVRVRPAAGAGFVVEDPFGIGESPKLRGWLEQRLDVTPGLRRFLQSVAGGEEEATDVASLQQRAAWEVESRLTIAVHEAPALHEHLVAMQRALLETESPKSPRDKWDDVAIKAQKAAERLLRMTNERYRRYGLSDALTMSKETNEELLNAIARDLGFATPLPPSLVRVIRGKVYAAERSSTGSLRPLIILSLLASRDEPAHPLRRAAAGARDLLQRLDALASIRDSAAHDGERTDQRRVRAGIETVFEAVKLLFLP